MLVVEASGNENRCSSSALLHYSHSRNWFSTSAKGQISTAHSNTHLQRHKRRSEQQGINQWPLHDLRAQGVQPTDIPTRTIHPSCSQQQHAGKQRAQRGNLNSIARYSARQQVLSRFRLMPSICTEPIIHDHPYLQFPRANTHTTGRINESMHTYTQPQHSNSIAQHYLDAPRPQTKPSTSQPANPFALPYLPSLP